MWKKIIINGITTNYSASELGQIRNDKTSFILSGNKKKNGYLEYCLYINGKQKYVLGHILIASTFIENINNYPQVNHINGQKDDNRITNLEWCTSSINNKHAWDNNLNKPHVLRPVKQFTMDKKYIRTFDSVADAIRATGAKKIREVCNGNRLTSGGYIWAWAEDFIPADTGKPKSVAQLDDENNIIAVYPSISEATRITGACRSGISAVCLGKQKKCLNYKWKFLNDDIVQ